MKTRSSHLRFHRLRGGFTLLELILAMSMVAMLTVTLYSAMSTAYKAKTAGERAIKPLRAVSIAADMIGRDLESIMMPDPQSVTILNSLSTVVPNITSGPFYGTKQSSGNGSADWIEFYAVGGDGTGSDLPLSEGIRKVSIGLNTDGEVPNLVRRIVRNPMISSQLSESEPEEEVICPNVRSFTVTYFDGTTWVDEWDSTMLYSSDATTSATGTGIPAIPMIIKIEMVLNVDNWQQPGQEPNTYMVTRMIPIPIAKPVYIQ